MSKIRFSSWGEMYNRLTKEMFPHFDVKTGTRITSKTQLSKMANHRWRIGYYLIMRELEGNARLIEARQNGQGRLFDERTK